MKKLLVAALTLMFSSGLFANCSPFALYGDWNVFYRDNRAPDSVIMPGSVFEIRYLKEHDQFTVQLKDETWAAKRNSWTSSCVDGVVVLSGVITDKRGSESLLVEMTRITDENELLARSASIRDIDQISIRVVRHLGFEGADSGNPASSGHFLVAPDPGHAHADRFGGGGG